MLSKIKLYAGIVGAALIGFLFALFKIEKSKKEAAETKAEAYKDNAVENAKVINQIKRKEEVRNEISMLTDSDIRDRLLKSARDRDRV